MNYRYADLSVAGHSPLASESTISTLFEYQSATGYARRGRTSDPPPRRLPSLAHSNICADTRAWKDGQFPTSRFRSTTAVKSPPPHGTAIDSHKPASLFAFVHSCASQPNFDCIRQVHLSTRNPLKHNRTHVRMSRFAFSALRQGISCSVGPTGILSKPKPRLNLNVRLSIGHYEDLGQHPLTIAKMRCSPQSSRH